ncbi:MAG: peptidylprolyl isomerase [Clostridia bacterium]|nr:peptidylprolyl isomerase [Clostridia bacterium]
MKKKICCAAAIVLALVLCFCAACNKKKGGDSAGTVNGLQLTRPVFGYAFSFMAEDLYRSGDVSFDKFGTDEFVALLKETKNSEGKSCFDALKEDTVEYARKYLVNESLARASSDWPSDDELKASGTQLKEEIENTYAYYIQYYGYTADLICMQLYGMPLDDYIDIFPRTAAVEKYNVSIENEMEPAAGELEQFYRENESKYRIVTVRHSLILTDEMTAAEKAEALKTAESYVEAVKNGTMTFDDVVALSEDTGVTTNDGYYEVFENSGFVKPFEDWAIAQTEVTEIPEIIETEYGYHLMICTGIAGYESDTVKASVDSGWRAKKVDDMLDEFMKDKKYALKNSNDEIAQKFTKMFCSMNFADEAETEPTEAVTATPKPEYNDAPLNDSVVAKVKDQNVLYPELVYLFGSTVSDVVGSDITFDDDMTEAQRYAYLKEFLNGPYKDDSGMTYMDKIRADTKEQLLQFRAAYMMALEKKEPFTEERIQSFNDEIDESVDYYLTYAGEYYGVTTRDEYMKYVSGMNVNDYKYFNLLQTFLSEYAEETMAAMTPSDEELKDYYLANEDIYRTISVRHIYLPYSGEGEEGAVTEEEKQTTKNQAAALVNKLVVDGDSPEAIVRAWSAADDATESAGIISVSVSSIAFTDEINSWIAAADSVGLDTIRTFETEEGVEIMYIVGILTFDGIEGETSSSEITLETLKSAISTAYKNESYEKAIDKYIADNGLTLDDFNEDLMTQVIDEYLTYENKEVTE